MEKHIPDTGIAALAVHLPPLAVHMRDIAALRGVDPAKLEIGLGCNEMALCPPDYGIVELASEAARRALQQWGGSLNDIGMIAVGTETSVDMSRPLSAWVADSLGLNGAVRSYEVKHACYGGTLALRQAVEWRLSGAARGKAALVIAADISRYEPASPGEPTGGAGAVAMVVAEPTVAAIDLDSYAWSAPAFDFWRPVGDPYPSVEGKLSLDCYMKAATECFQQLMAAGTVASLDEFAALCFHVPFPKMVKKALGAVATALGLDEAQAEALFAHKVNPAMEWNRYSGNAYTASLWIAVAKALAGQKPGARLAAFSYGSGFGAELLTLTAGPAATAAPWVAEVEADLAGRTLLDAGAYDALRRNERHDAALVRSGSQQQAA